MIINTVMRTDIPPFYSEWFYNRIAESYVVVRSPYNGQLTRYDISTDKVDIIGFCTKNPALMLQRLNELDAYNSCGHLCRYCYANYDSRTVKENIARHNPKSPLIIGEIHPGEKIVQASWLDREISLF